MKRALLGLVWFAAIYIGSCMAIGMIAGAVAGSGDPAHAREAGRAAADQVIRPYAHYLLAASALLAVIGTVTGFLPGTKKSKPV